MPEKEGRFYTECDIDTLGADRRGARRIVFSNDCLTDIGQETEIGIMNREDLEEHLGEYAKKTEKVIAAAAQNNSRIKRKDNRMKNFLTMNPVWIREPKQVSVTEDKVEVITEPGTDLWQRTYYGFQNDNAPVLQARTGERYFSFVVRTRFESKHRFDQCGVVMYLDSENWFKASIEYENEEFQRLGSVVTNHGFSDWATTDIPAEFKEMWYRFSRRESDYCVECSRDGINFKQMRIFHMWEGAGEIAFGIYACSPEQSSFKASFTDMEMMECKWEAHK